MSPFATSLRTPVGRYGPGRLCYDSRAIMVREPTARWIEPVDKKAAIIYSPLARFITRLTCFSCRECLSARRIMRRCISPVANVTTFQNVLLPPETYTHFHCPNFEPTENSPIPQNPPQPDIEVLVAIFCIYNCCLFLFFHYKNIHLN